MKKLAVTLAALAAVASALAFAAAPAAGAPKKPAAPFGVISYIEGGATITRASKTIAEPNIGDAVQPDDLLKTAADGLVVIDLDKSTGMKGTLTVKPKTAIYLRLKPDASGPKSSIELLAGQIGSKLGKLGGSPTLTVNTGNAVAGVRGTAFGVSASVNGDSVVYCTEGEVSFSDGGEELAVPAGKAAEKRESERLRTLPVAISSAEAFEKKWMADEIEAFRSNAPKALASYRGRYKDLLARFNAEFDPFQKSATLGKWLREDQSGARINPRDATTLKEKKEMGAYLLKLRKVLVSFERIYYRMDQVADLVAGTSLEKTPLGDGTTAIDFVRKYRSEAPSLERRVALFRFAEKLYELRDEGGAGLPGMDAPSGGEDDFFGSDSDFDF